VCRFLFCPVMASKEQETMKEKGRRGDMGRGKKKLTSGLMEMSVLGKSNYLYFC
jgi:hypothetical protein